jgi:DNA-binding response OmpR family regulator
LIHTPSAHVVVVEPETSPVPDIAVHLGSLPAVVQVVKDTEPLEPSLHPTPSVVVLVIAEPDTLAGLPAKVKSLTKSPILAIVAPELLRHDMPYVAIDDFAVTSATPAELHARLQRLMRLNPESGEILRRGDLAINTSTCEVSLGGRLMELTFKEYTLLKFLASNPGRVHTREVLLDKVWGYDYYGGDRTVDVHVRRVRSKIEDSNHAFIDTVRNIGYRFRKDM